MDVGNTQMRHYECPVCHDEKAVRNDGKIRLHKNHLAYPSSTCSGSMRQVLPNLGVIPRNEVVTRDSIADEIRSMIPIIWRKDSIKAAEYRAWADVADFVERTGDWFGWEPNVTVGDTEF